MKILILGGISEAKQLASTLTAQGHCIIYSIAGIVRQPDLPCEVHIGGFSRPHQDGVQGLSAFCAQQEIKLVIDATHPYANIISSHAAQAAKISGIRCWRYERPAWNPKDFSNWHEFHHWPDLLPQIKEFSNVFFSIGLSALNAVNLKPPEQHWIIRSARAFDNQVDVTQIEAIGPFNYQAELLLLKSHRVDALVCKNSGGDKVVDKLTAANTLGIPLFIQQRPALPLVEQIFSDVNSIVQVVNSG